MIDAHPSVLENAIIEFPEGLPGFDNQNQFVLLRPPDLHPVLLLENISEKTADSDILRGCYRRGTRFNWKKRAFLRTLLVRHTYSVRTELAYERSYLTTEWRGFRGLPGNGSRTSDFCAFLAHHTGTVG